MKHDSLQMMLDKECGSVRHYVKHWIQDETERICIGRPQDVQIIF